jgi:Zn-dependent peptidase ImmA (M78 family)
LTQAELASAVSLDRSALTKVENGSRRVSALELARIADALGERIEWFVTDPPPAIVSHRNLREPGAPSPTIDRVAERAARNVEFAARLDDRWSLTVPEQVRRPGTVEEAERSATRARALLGLDDTEPFLDASARASRAGLLVFSFDLGAEAADAASILLPRGGVAVVNGHLHVGRRRLAVAHELGHYLFADEYTVDWRIAEQPDDTTWEARLDRFARAILLPVVGLRRVWGELRDGGSDVRTAAVRAASVFRVDMSTLARRLFELGHVGQRDAHQIRVTRTTRADIVEFDLLVHDELAPAWLPRHYEESVLRLYRNETVSPARATDLLFDAWSEEDLPALPQLPENAIWDFV